MDNVSIKDYIDSKIDLIMIYITNKLEDLRCYVDARLKAIESATTLVAANMDKRFDSVNEFRAQLKDQNFTFITRAEHTVIIDKLSKDIDDLKTVRDIQTGKASMKSVVVAYIISAIGIIIAIVSLINNLSR
jgi:hypothetical protein